MDETDTGILSAALAQALTLEPGQTGPCAAAAVASIFPAQGLSSYFDDVYGTLNYILSERAQKIGSGPPPALATDVIDTVLNATVIDIQTGYVALRNAQPAPSSEALNRYILAVSDSLADNVLDKLHSPATLPVFLIAATMRLLLIQELALTDPAFPGNPNLSPFAALLKSQAQTYATSAQEHWTLMKILARGEEYRDSDLDDLNQQLGDADAIAAQLQAVANAAAPVPGPELSIVQADCVTTVTRSPNSAEIESWATWSTTGAATVLLDQALAAPCGSQRYISQENAVGYQTGTLPPETITATGFDGRSVTLHFTNS